MTRFLVNIVNTNDQSEGARILSLPSDVREFLPTITPPYRLNYIEDGETGQRWTRDTLSTFYPPQK